MEYFEYEKKKKRKLKKGPILVVVSCVLCLIIGAAGGFLVSRISSDTLVIAETIYDEVYHMIQNRFFDTTDSDYSIEERMLSGMIAGLGDKHTSYLTIEEASDFAQSIDGSFEGIGVSFSTIRYGGLILEVFEGSPASRAGLLNGDIITHIEGTSIEGYDADKIKNTIIGEKNTNVSVRVLRDGKYLDFNIKRGSVESSAAHEIRHENGIKVGYLRLTTFGSTTASLVENALKDFKDNHIENICIDLRGNAGGYLTSVVDLLDLFIPEGELMFSVEYKNQDPAVYKATDIKKYEFKNGFLLVDSGSASSSEVMISALSEILQYKIIGETTYGKGTVQTQLPLTNSATLKLTTGKWTTSKGTWINEVGITPDYIIESDDSKFIVDDMSESYHYDQVNDVIKHMQIMLEAIKYPIDRTDGYFSDKTKQTVESFEKDYGLKVNGIFEKEDAKILLSALSYDLYQEREDLEYLKMIELLK